jgi:hypothetical protein
VRDDGDVAEFLDGCHEDPSLGSWADCPSPPSREGMRAEPLILPAEGNFSERSFLSGGRNGD